MSADAVRASLGRVIDPEIRRPITELDMVRSVAVEGGRATVELVLTIIGCPAADTIERDVRAAVLGTPGITDLDLTIGVMTVPEREALVARLRGTRTTQFGPDTLTKIYAITSGKGGVGKSTLTANLAVALAAQGLKVGLVDADVFGFSIPGILGLGPDARPTKVGDLMMPPTGHGVQVISIGMFVERAPPCRGAGRCCTARSSSSSPTSGSATSTCCCSTCRPEPAMSRSRSASCSPTPRCSSSRPRSPRRPRSPSGRDWSPGRPVRP